MITLKRDNVEIIVSTEEQAKIKESQGFRRLYGAKPVEPAKPAGMPEKVANKPISEMTKNELIAYAYENGIDIDPRAKKADILAALK